MGSRGGRCSPLVWAFSWHPSILSSRPSSVARLAQPVIWGDEEAQFVIMLTLNKHSAGDQHMRIFSRLARAHGVPSPGAEPAKISRNRCAASWNILVRRAKVITSTNRLPFGARAADSISGLAFSSAVIILIAVVRFLQNHRFAGAAHLRGTDIRPSPLCYSRSTCKWSSCGTVNSRPERANRGKRPATLSSTINCSKVQPAPDGVRRRLSPPR